MDQSNIIILGDFAENYTFVVQDEIQSYHWNTQQCSLHPLVIYYKDDNGVLKHISYCFISDDITHDVTYNVSKNYPTKKVFPNKKYYALNYTKNNE